MIRVLRVVRIARVRGTWRCRCQPMGPGETTVTTVLLGPGLVFKGRTLSFLGRVDSSPILEKMNLVDAIFFQTVD